MPLPLLIPLAIKGVCVLCAAIGTCYCAKKAADAYQKGQETKQGKYALKTKSLEAAKEDNGRLAERDIKIDNLLALSQTKENQLDKQASNIKKKLDDPNISKEKEQELRDQLAFVQTQLDEERKNIKKLQEEKERNRKQRDKNNETINNAGLNPDDKSWVWEFLTLENIFLMGACYMRYKLVKDDK